MLINSRWRTATHFIKDNKLDYLLVFLVVFLVMSWLQASPFFLDPDPFYHAKMAELMQPGAVVEDFRWLQGTNFEQHYADHYWLYHLLLRGLIYWLPTFVAIKLLGVLLVSILALYIYYWLKKHNGKWPLLFVFVLFTSLSFVSRMNLVKVAPLSILFLLLGIELAINYRYWLVGLLSLLYVWLYGGFLLLPFVIAVWLLLETVYHRYEQDRFKSKLHNFKNYILGKLGAGSRPSRKKWLVMIFCVAGIGVGLVTHPYWPENLSFYQEQVINIALVNNEYKTMNAGSEWYPYNPGRLLEHGGLIFVVIALSLLLVLLPHKKVTKLTAYFGLLSLIFFVLTLLTRRYIEYFVPIVVIFLSLLWRDIMPQTDWSELVRKYIRPHKVYQILFGVLMLLAIIVPTKNYFMLKKQINGGFALNHLQAAATWLRYHTPDQSLVINSRWTDWPALFYFNDNNNYWLGLDPRFMLTKYPQTTTDYIQMVKGESRASAFWLLKERFQADYLLINKKDKKFHIKIKDNIYFQLEYEDKEVWVYKIQ